MKRYRINATVTLFSIPVVSRADVGSGFASMEEAASGPGNPDGHRTLAIQFGAGSFPSAARGLNRLGFIQEVIVELPEGDLDQCAYFAYMTKSGEDNLDQAKAALANSGPITPYLAAEGAGRRGCFMTRLLRVDLPSRLTWSDYPTLTGKIRDAFTDAQSVTRRERKLAPSEGAPATFLYAVRAAMGSRETHTSRMIVYNGKAFQLSTRRKPDATAAARFAERNLVRPGRNVVRLDATLHDEITGVNTPFKVWYEADSPTTPPLCFEYQARSFLRLTFEADPSSTGPLVQLALNKGER